ncbi:hypothetical protein [Moraxella catarrhalis]|uniref:hypothetical protein n=1 Tax=Moraxella catarrhalis TaxID=480 RepID=UPI000202AED8|nr:hypothetical protein [Moraxella catarrhalis]EGE09631.1 hypothetical protein E9M_09199 [Moraxella catarrhalis 46P47B1]MPW68237.1 hypothetical protein [Moraxella catarrhalis]MPX57159.1 hypothetical protein [Moraxella catarrhalis]
MFDIAVEMMNKPIPFWLCLLLYCIGGWVFYQMGRNKERKQQGRIATLDQHAQKAVDKTILMVKRDMTVDLSQLTNYVLVVKKDRATLLNLDSI